MKLKFQLLKEVRPRTEIVVDENEAWDKYYMYRPHCRYIQVLTDDNKVVTQKYAAPQYGR